MIPVLFVMWCIAAPMGFLAGDVFVSKFKSSPDIPKGLPWLSAVFPPLGAALAMVVIAHVEAIEVENEDE